eukprot:jgi/Bigna1/81877/fgenesh1_pg.85_\
MLFVFVCVCVCVFVCLCVSLLLLLMMKMMIGDDDDAVVTSESLPRVLQALMKHVSDLEDPSYPKVCQTLRTIGCLLPVGSWIEHTLRSLQTNAEGGHSAWLVLLNEMVKGTPKGSLFPYMLKLSRVLSRCSIALSEDRPTRFFARAAMTSLLLHYDNNNSSAAGGGGGSTDGSSARQGIVPVQELFWGLIQLHSKIDWSSDSEQLRLIVTLFRRSAHVIHKHLPSNWGEGGEKENSQRSGDLVQSIVSPWRH